MVSRSSCPFFFNLWRQMGTLPASKPSSMALSKSGAFKCPVKPSPWVVIWSWEQLIYDDDTRRTPTQNANHDPCRFDYGTKRTNSIQHVKKMNSENTILLSVDVRGCVIRPFYAVSSVQCALIKSLSVKNSWHACLATQQRLFSGILPFLNEIWHLNVT